MSPPQLSLHRPLLIADESSLSVDILVHTAGGKMWKRNSVWPLLWGWAREGLLTAYSFTEMWVWEMHGLPSWVFLYESLFSACLSEGRKFCSVFALGVTEWYRDAAKLPHGAQGSLTGWQQCQNCDSCRDETGSLFGLAGIFIECIHCTLRRFCNGAQISNNNCCCLFHICFLGKNNPPRV